MDEVERLLDDEEYHDENWIKDPNIENRDSIESSKFNLSEN